MSDEFWPSFFAFAKDAIKPVNLLIYTAIIFILKGIADLPHVVKYAHELIAVLRGCK